MRHLLGRIGLGPWLAAITAALMLLLTFVIVMAIGDTARAEVEKGIAQSLEELAFQTTDKLDRGMFERYREVQLLSEREEFRNPEVPAERKRAILESMQQTYPYYAWIGLTDNQGKVIAATGKLLEGADVSKRPWFGNAYRDMHLSDVHEAVLLAKLLPNPSNEPKRFFDVAFLYQDEKGQTAGVLGTHLSWRWAKEVEQSVIRPLANRKKVDTLIVDRNGIVLLGPDELRDKTLSQASFARAQQAKYGSLTEKWPDGKNYLVGFSKSEGYANYPGFGWTVLVRQEVEEAFAPVARLQKHIGVIGFTAAFLFAALAFFAANRFTRPLRAITGAAQDIEIGKASAIPSLAGSFFEVRTLTQVLNSLILKISANEDRLRELNVSLESRIIERTADLTSAMSRLSASERRVHAVLNTALDAFVGVDELGKITDWNPRAEAIFGWRRAEVIGRFAVEIIFPPQTGQQGDTSLGRLWQQGSASMAGQRLQLTAMRRSGEPFPVEMTIGLIHDDETHFFGTFIQDISVRKKAEDDLAKERELLSAVLATIDVGVLACGPDGTLTLFNHAAHEFHGLPAEHLPPEQWSQHYDLFAADGVSPLALEEIPLFQALHGKIVENTEMTILPKGGQARYMLSSARPLLNASGQRLGAVAAMKDVSGLKEAERKRTESEEMLRTIADNLPVLIAYIDKEKRFRFANATYEAWFGIAARDMLGRTVEEVLGADAYQKAKDSLQRSLDGETIRFESETRLGGALRTMEVVGIPHLRDGAVEGLYMLSADVTEARNHARQLDLLAHSDALTGLPNRRAYEEKLRDAALRARRNKQALGLMYLDIDHFKQINDNLGHAGGDEVLKEFGRRLKTSIRATDLASRLAGDEFTIILEGVHSIDEVALVAQKILAAIQTPFTIGGQPRDIGTSIGIAFMEAPDSDLDALARRADEALYKAKQAGRNRYRISEAA